jgi:hypothetical protein
MDHLRSDVANCSGFSTTRLARRAPRPGGTADVWRRFRAKLVGSRIGAPPVPPSDAQVISVMPGASFRVMLPEIGPDSYFVPLVRYDLSVAGDRSAKDISNLQIAPTLNLDLPNRWFFTFYPNPDIRVNFGDPVAGQTGRLFLPFDAMVGRVLKNGWVASLEGSVPIIKDYPVYDYKVEARVHFSY